MVMCTCYADASGKTTYPVFSVCGVIATVRTWRRFEWQWRRELAKEGIKEFHMTDFASSRGEFTQWKGDGERRGRFFRELVRIIRNTLSTPPIVVNVEMDAWKLINQEFLLEEHLKCPYALSGFGVVKQARDWVRSKNDPPRIRFVFEDGDEGKGHLSDLCEKVSITPVFRSKSAAVPCQAADLIAWKSRIACQNSLVLSTKVTDRSEPADDMENILQLFKEYESVMHTTLSAESKIFSPDALRRTCIGRGIPPRA
jgi:Protein of unknown function (DUF3800)